MKEIDKINSVLKSNLSIKKIEEGVIVLETTDRKLDFLYETDQFKLWDSIIKDRIKYYTKKNSIAGRIAHFSYNSLAKFNRKNVGYIVDLGCGDGSEVELIDNKSRYIGVDRNLERLIILKRKYPECHAIYCDASDLPFRDRSIDFIFSSNAFEHFWYLKEVVYECYRILKDDGSATVIFPTEGGLWNLGRKLFSQPRFEKKYPEIDFDLISHIEHCNNATQIIRTFETFFHIRRKYLPLRIPTIYLNFLVEIVATKNNKISATT